MITTPNMALKLWNLIGDLFDHSQLENNFTALDQHDHSSGKGVQIGTAGIAPGAITDPLIAAGTITGDKLNPTTGLSAGGALLAGAGGAGLVVKDTTAPVDTQETEFYTASGATNIVTLDHTNATRGVALSFPNSATPTISMPNGLTTPAVNATTGVTTPIANVTTMVNTPAITGATGLAVTTSSGDVTVGSFGHVTLAAGSGMNVLQLLTNGANHTTAFGSGTMTVAGTNSGASTTVTHGMGATPVLILLAPKYAVSLLLTNPFSLMTGSPTNPAPSSTSFDVTCHFGNSFNAGGAVVGFYWLAII